MTPGTIRGVRSGLILLLDLIAIIIGFVAAFKWRIGELPDSLDFNLWLISTTFIVLLFLTGTYSKERSTTLPRLPIRTFWICVVAGLVCIGWLYVLGPSEFNEYFGRGVLPTATLVCGVLTTLNRFGVNRIYHLQEKGAEILYLGFSENTKGFLAELQNHSEVRSVTLVGAVGFDSMSDRVSSSDLPLTDLCDSNRWNSVIIDPGFVANVDETEALVKLRLSGTPVLSLAEFYEYYWFMIPVTGIDDNWFLRSQGFTVLDNPIARRVKRGLDIVCSSLVLLLSIPLMLICAVAIKLTSRGPVFYQQQRVGLQGHLFTIFKLRTMRQDAESEGAQWAQSNDPRITRVGRFLRASRLDEIPQCWNVLKGDMSFVGPRPERPEFTEQLAEQIPYYELRHLVKPGITGWAQVIFPYGASVDDALKKLQYELYYIKNQSFMLDLNILLRTMITVFQRAGR